MIAITGATGRLGRLVVENLLERGIEPGELVAVVRNPQKAADIAARGVEIRRADYTDAEALTSAFTGVERLLLISSSVIGERLPHHRNALEAAKKAGVGFIAYTSLLRADTNPMTLAKEHAETEALIRESGIPFAFLRNGWYTENYTMSLGPTLEHGAAIGSAGSGRISAAPRIDFAEAAAAVITGDGHEGAVYELAGDEAFTMDEYAAEVTRLSGTEVVYRNLPEEEYSQALVGFGVPEYPASVLANAEALIQDGHLYAEDDDLRRLIGRPTTPLADVIEQALEEQVGSDA